MTRHFDNVKSVQAQLNELREAKERVKVLESELKTFMEENDMDSLDGETTCYVRTWVNDTLIFDSVKFKADHADLYESYKTKEKAGYYKFEEKVLK